MPEKFIPLYDLESLTEDQRREYLTAVCNHLGVPDNLNLVALTYVDDAEGPARLVPYAKRGATENVRNRLEIDIESLTHQMVGGSIVFTATGKSRLSGRHEISTGSKYIEGLTGATLDDGIMTASTRALRRLTLQFVGAGVLDESEVNQRKTVHVTSALLVSTPQPTVKPSSEPGKDITPLPEELGVEPTHHEPVIVIAPDPQQKTQEEFEAAQAKLRVDAIAKLNEDAPVKKIRKPRSPKKTVDLGPSELPMKADIKPDTLAPVAPLTPEPTPVVEISKPDIKPDIAPVPLKPRLSAEVVKPFRQRLFRVVNDYLEPNGFAPKEGMGNAEKMRSFAALMFPEVTNMNELSVEQWEKYLTTLENKIKSEGPVATWKYVEESIGI